MPEPAWAEIPVFGTFFHLGVKKSSESLWKLPYRTRQFPWTGLV